LIHVPVAAILGFMPRHPYNAEIGQTDLMGAAYNGDAEEVACLLSMPCDINAQDDHRMTALMYAAMKGHANVAQCLVEHKVDLELQSNQRYTALMYAVCRGHAGTVQALLRADADPNVRGEDDVFETPLTLAAWHGHLAIVRLLVAAGANVSLRGGIIQLPAEAIARRQGHHDVSEFLLYHEKQTPRKQ
jgi:ankyrin repeat protein